ncbi:MAG TPA: hypothetical protein VKB88_17475 [Bryobacteraceae bacterium]|nr:hypothetical protein [Bryobacteraceae bacterium]
MSLLSTGIGFAQDTTPPPAAAGKNDQTMPSAPDEAPSSHKRIFWIIPNYRTSPSLVNYRPLTAGEKFKIATQDSFDRGTVALALAFAGQSQLTKAEPSFGQGVEGYAHYFVTSYGDLVIGDYLTEAVFPALLHQDPRFFRRGTGSVPSRMLYAVGQTFWTHKDSGGSMFNFSELGGNAAAAAIGNAYYPDNRTAANAATRWATQIGVDMAGNVLKEFWPDIYDKLSRKHHR